MKTTGYKIIIVVLSAVVLLQWMVISTGRLVKKAPKPKVSLKGKIAIVIDDWGYNKNNIPVIDQITFPLTASILPNLSYSRQVAEELHGRGFEIILHLPMQPHERYSLEKNTITTSADEKSAGRIIEEDLASIAYAVGVSNHMGSAATENSRVMGVVFKELKKRRLFFLDSFVTAKSVCFDLSRKAGIGFARRDIFLDNVEEAGYINQQIYKLKLRAKAKGFAIGIGHDRKITLQVLKEAIPKLEKEGFKPVFLSELVR